MLTYAISEAFRCIFFRLDVPEGRVDRLRISEAELVDWRLGEWNTKKVVVVVMFLVVALDGSVLEVSNWLGRVARRSISLSNRRDCCSKASKTGDDTSRFHVGGRSGKESKQQTYSRRIL